MQKTIQTSSLNSKVGRIYTWDPIKGREENPPNHDPILEMIVPETVPIPTEQYPKPW